MSNVRWRVDVSDGSASATSASRRPPVRKPLNCNPCRQSKAKCDRQAPCRNCRRRQCISSCSYGDDPTFAKQKGSPNFESYQGAALENGTTSKPQPEHTTTSLRKARLDEYAQPCHRDYNQSTHNPSMASGAKYLESPSSDGAASASTRSTASAVVDSHLRQFRWDAPLHASVSDHVPKADPVQSNVGSPFESNTDLDTLLALLPPTQHCDYLVSRYFNLFSPLFHILHRPSFDAEYSVFAHDPHSISLSWLALLFIIIALGVTCLEDDDTVLRDLGRGANGAQIINSLSARFRSIAMKCLAADNFLANHSISTLQATILLIYAINHSQGVGQSWTILGIALNMSIALGCHIDGETMNLSVLDTQQRRRCWAGIMMLQATQSSVFGLADTMRLPDDRVKLPADVNDIDIKVDRLDTPSSQPTEMSYMLYKFRLYRLSSEVCKFIIGPSSPSWQDISHIETTIREEEMKWNERYLRDGGPALLPDRDQAHWNILHCYANQLYLLINRPSLNTPPENRTPTTDPFSRCLSAGLALLDAHRLFCTSPAFRQYRWFTNGLCSFFALHGAVTIAACIMARPNSADIERSRMAFEEVVQRFSERRKESNICARALPVLNHLQSMLMLPVENSMEEVARSPQVPELRLHLVSPSMDSMELDPGFEEAFRAWTQAGNWTGPDAIQWDVMEAAVAVG